jgi:hypothetical protein
MELALFCCLVLSGIWTDVGLEVIEAESYNLELVRFVLTFVEGLDGCTYCPIG